MTKKLKTLVFLNLALVVGLVLALAAPDRKSSIAGPGTAFAFADTAVVDEIRLGSHLLEKKLSGRWVLDQKHTVSPQMVRTIFAMLQRMTVKRPVPEGFLPAVEALFKQQGTGVSVFSEGELLKSYQITGDSTESYAQLPDGAPFAVYIPGYYIRLHEVFRVNEDEWRDGRVLLTNWRTLQHLHMSYPKAPSRDFSVVFDTDYYKVPGIEALDTLALYRYLSQFEQFEAERYLTADPRKDSLMQAVPLAVIDMADLNPDRDNRLRVYQDRGDLLGYSEKTGDLLLYGENALRSVLVAKDHFRKKHAARP